MKILKTDSFVSERIKVQPITNAELDAMNFRKIKIAKIDNPVSADIKPGVAVCVKDNMTSQWHIVFDGGNLPEWADACIPAEHKGAGRLLLIRYCSSSVNKCAYWRFSSFKTSFPYHFLYTFSVNIVDVYNTNINPNHIKSLDELSEIMNDIQQKLGK